MIKNNEELKDEITSIIYGADWKSQDIADAHKPDVEAVMKLTDQYVSNKVIGARKKVAFEMWLNAHDILRDGGEPVGIQEAINVLTLAYNRTTGEPIDEHFAPATLSAQQLNKGE